ncbi:hypothetical protein NliqN6_6788 [Naganishia liquefaciens]|uniref:Uncharacterized protein n=1 Tax=Naganishia liquefaciens TaxID=104408 RepID=A0A8H3YKB8_9TREE|nr:hypothetical protein NliqN6_6788 [Naganishia liquefaciens]
MHAPATESTFTSRSRRNPSSHALRPLVSPLPLSHIRAQTLESVKPRYSAPTTGGGTAAGTGSKPIMDWFRKLGHGMRLDPPGAGTRGSTMSRPTMGRGGKSSKDKSFRSQVSSSNGKALVKAGRDQQTTASNDAMRRRSSHIRTASVKSFKSIRSSRLIPLFSPPYTTPHVQIPRAETFMTRSSRSPASSLISSDDGSARGSTEHSLAASYLDVNDPDARSFVPSVMADEDASLRPFPPSPGRSSVPHSIRRTSVAQSISSTDGIRAASRHETLSPSRPSQHMRRDSQSTTATTYSSFGAPSRTWTNDGASRTRSVDTRPTTILGSLDFLPQRVAHIAQAVPPSVTSAPMNTARGGSQIHRTLTWDSGLSASPSVPSPFGTSITANQTGQQQVSRRSILERPLDRPSPASSSPPSTNSFYPCHVPRHSHPHPRDNPRPFAPPEANASLVTLASSEFAQPGVAREEPDLLGPPLELAASAATPRLGAYEYDLTPGLHVDEEEEPYRYVAEQTPMHDANSSSRHRAVSYFDRHSSYYFNPTSTPATTNGGHSSSINTGAPGTTHLGNASLRSHDDRSGWDDRASVTAMRRRGSWESGESSFSGAGRTGVAVNGVQRGSFSLASVHARYSPSLNPPLRDGAAGEMGGTVGPSNLSQSLKRMSVAEGPESSVEDLP